MWRALAYLAVLGVVAWALSWLADNPGTVSVTWRGLEYNASLTVALGAVLALALALSLALALLRFVLRAPALMALASRARRRERGFAALSRGMIAVGAGDLGEAQRSAREAERFLGDESLDQAPARPGGAAFRRPRRRRRARSTTCSGPRAR